MTTSGGRLRPAMRWALLLAAVGLAAILVVAGWLRPDPRGHGTHTQLGLPACAYHVLTGRRCPACGLTTAFAWSVRGRLDRAWQANPAGAWLAVSCTVLVPWLMISAASGRPRWGARSIEGPLVIVIVAAVALGLGAWTLRMILGRVLG